MQPKRTLIILLTLFLASTACFLFWNLAPHTIAFHLPRRAIKLAALCITGTALAVSTSVFQTVSGNTILTPSILGLDSLYLLVQSIIVFFL
ncbi:MAG: iron chelate uptake ABC transporter family permease subunit, partial [Sphaerochaeta sp.]